MKAALASLLAGGIFLGGVLVGMGVGADSGIPPPVPVVLEGAVEAPGASRTPGRSPSPSSVEEVRREVEYGELSDYVDADGKEEGEEEGDGSGKAGDNSGRGSEDSGKGKEDSHSGSENSRDDGGDRSEPEHEDD